MHARTYIQTALILLWGAGCATTSEQSPAEAAGASSAAGHSHAHAMYPLDSIPWAPVNKDAPQGLLMHRLAGDPKTGPSKALVKIPAGFRIPLHFHNADFIGITLSEGMAHGRTVETAQTLPAGSHWYQPASETHVDSCESEQDCLLLVLFKGPLNTNFVDTPAEGQKAGTMTPFNEIDWKLIRPDMEKGPRWTILHGNPKEGPFDAIISVPGGFETNIHTHSHPFVGAIVAGNHHRGPDAENLVSLTRGGVWSEKPDHPHMEKCVSEEGCIFVASFDGPLDQKAVEIKMNP